MRIWRIAAPRRGALDDIHAFLPRVVKRRPEHARVEEIALLCLLLRVADGEDIGIAGPVRVHVLAVATAHIPDSVTLPTVLVRFRDVVRGF